MKANAPEKIWIDPATDLPKLSGHIDKLKDIKISSDMHEMKNIPRHAIWFADELVACLKNKED